MGVTTKLKRATAPLYRPLLTQKGKQVQRYTKLYETETVIPDTIFYESRDGQSLTDSPLAIFEYLLAHDTDRRFTHIWSVTSSEELREIKKQYSVYSHVHFVVRFSEEYLKRLVTSEYLINNSTFPSFVTIKNEQTYINTWHGTPLKSMGLDIPGNPSLGKNVIRNFFMADYLLSPNAHTTNMFLDSYRLRHNYTGKVLESGYPRIDQTIHSNSDEILKLLFSFDKKLDLSKKILLYTPTWKGTGTGDLEREVTQIEAEMARLRESVGQTYNVMIKVHPFLYKEAKKNSELLPFLIPDVIDTNKLLKIVDLLVTDYSSIFFDFLVTKKPIIFYCWDDDLYSNERGKYIEYKDLPGPVTFTVEELVTAIREESYLKQDMLNNYERCLTTYAPFDDGNATKRYVEYLFYQKEAEPDKMNLFSNQDKGKKRLIFYPGGLRNNGITSSFLNLVESIDYDKYDVTCFLGACTLPEQVENVKRIPKCVSLIFRFDTPNFLIGENYKDLNYHTNGVTKGNINKYPHEMYQRECQRLLGKQYYDVAIDFSGYSLYWGKIILAVNATKKMCYLHSDMMADSHRQVNGKKIHRVNLKGMFSVYKWFDNLVSVTEMTNDINKEQLLKYADEEKFVSAPNVLNPKRILTQEVSTNDIKSSLKTTLYQRTGVLKQLKVMCNNTRPDSPLKVQRELTLSHEHVIILGRFDWQQQTFYKITQDSCYVGWVLASDVNLVPDTMVSEKTITWVGKLKGNEASSFYSKPLMVDGATALSLTSPFADVFVEIKKIVQTTSQQSALVVVKGKEIGWVSLNDITLLSELNPRKQTVVSKLKRKGFKQLNQIKYKAVLATLDTQVTHKEKLGGYYKVKAERGTRVYSSPKETDPYEKVQLSNGLLRILSLSTNDQGQWYEVVTLSDRTGWIEKKQVQLESLPTTIIYREKDVSYEVQIVHQSCEVFATTTDFLLGNGTSVRSLDKVSVIRECVLTNGETYLSVFWDQKNVWLNQRQTERLAQKGVVNHLGECYPYPDDETVNIVTVGRLSEEKNQQLLIQGFAEFYQTNDKARLYLIGSGPELSRLQKEVTQLGLESVVTFIGQLSRPYDFMKQCDVFVLTSKYEGQSMVLLEAMTLGMTVISTDIPVCRNVLEDGACGFITETNDAVGISNALKQAISDKKTVKLFDACQYDREAIQTFERLVEV